MVKNFSQWKVVIWKWPEIQLLQKQIFVEVVQGTAVLRNFQKINRRRPVQQSLFKTSCNIVRKETLAQVFSNEFWTFFKKVFIAEYFWVTASAPWKVTQEVYKDLPIECW